MAANNQSSSNAAGQVTGQSNITLGGQTRASIAPMGNKSRRLMTASQKANVEFTIENVSSSTWFSPNQPLRPTAPDEVRNRTWDFPTSWNLNYIPRTWEPVSFDRLRSLSQWNGIARLCMETRKDQIAALKWNFRPIAIGIERAKIRNKSQDRIQALTEFFQKPDREHDFAEWMNGILDQHFMYDAVALHRQKTRGGQPYAFVQHDAAKINVLIDADGNTPKPPSPAYQFVAKGIPAADYSTFDSGDMFYFIKNFRADHRYGFGPIEQCIYYVEMLIERVKQQLAFYTHGDKPQGLMEAPPGLSQEQIDQMQGYWDSIFRGNIQERARLWWVPSGTNYKPLAEESLFDKFDEWLARVICYAFSISPQPFIKEMNRSTANQSQETAAAEGLAPTSAWAARMINKLVREDFGIYDLEFAWEQSSEFDPVKKATIHNLYVRAGIEALDEAREDAGYDPQGGAFATPMFATMNGYVPIEAGTEVHQQNMDARQQQMDQGAEAHEQRMAAPQTQGAAPGAQGQGGGKPKPGAGTKETKGKPPGGGAVAKFDGSQVVAISRPVMNDFDVASWALNAGVPLVPGGLSLDEGVMVSAGLPMEPEPSDFPVVLIEAGEMSFEAEGTDLWLNINSPIVTMRQQQLGGMLTMMPRILISQDFTGDADDLPPPDFFLILGDEQLVSALNGLAKVTDADVIAAGAETDQDATEDQKHAGNYKKGHITIQGLDITIENPPGSIRESRHDKWKAVMPTTYGYIKQTDDADGDQVDVFIGPDPECRTVYVIDQVNDDGTFDEHKCFIGYTSWGQAQDDYVKSYADAEAARPGYGHHNIGSVTSMTMDQFKAWVFNQSATNKPMVSDAVKKHYLAHGYTITTISAETLLKSFLGRMQSEILRKDFNPDEPRDEHGMWTSGGSTGAMVMASPSKLDSSSWRDAKEGLASSRQRQFVEATKAILTNLGLKGSVTSAIGAWADGAENSTYQEIEGKADFDTVKTAAAMEGLLGEQKATIAFIKDASGKETLYRATVPDSAEGARDTLDKLGVGNYTLIDSGNGTTKVAVLDFDGDAGTKMEALGDHYDVEGTADKGYGAFIGSWDSREEGDRAYQQTINGYKAVHGESSVGFYDSLYNHWRGAGDSSQAQKVTFTQEVVKSGALPFVAATTTKPGPTTKEIVSDEHHSIDRGRNGGGSRVSFDSEPRSGMHSGIPTVSAPPPRLSKDFNPDEARDDHGRWMDGGESSGNYKDFGAPEHEIRSRLEYADKRAHELAENPTNLIDSPERDALRSKIANELYNNEIGNRQRNKDATIVLGLPASGKSTLSTKIAMEKGAVTIDPDLAKFMLPEYENGLGAMATHEESSAITKQVLGRAISNGDNFVWERVDSPDKTINDIRSLKKAGYTVHVALMRVNEQVAEDSALKRFLGGGRYLPVSVIESFNGEPDKAFDAVKASGLADSTELWTRDAHGPARRVD